MTTTKKAVVETLIECGATHAFTLPGLGITWMLDEFDEVRDKLRVVLTRSEQVASVMAQVYGRLTGKPGVYMGQGPFASTTGAFGILEAYFAGTPMVVLTDTSCYDGFGMYGVYQTMTGDYGAADIQSVMKTMTKFCAYATEPHEAVYGLQLAFKHASLPRTGPAAVIMKSPIIRRELVENPRVKLYPSKGYLQYCPPTVDNEAVARVAKLIAQADRPVIIAGNGLQNDAGRERLAQVAGRAGIVVTTSYNGKGVVDETSDFSAGMLGTWGSRTANRCLENADLVLVLGASLGPDYLRFRDQKMVNPAGQTWVQVDIDARNAGWVVPVNEAITADAAEFLRELAKYDLGESSRAGRIRHLARLKEENGYNLLPELPFADGTLHYTHIIRALDEALTPDSMLTLDAGNNRIWATSALRIKTPGQLIVPGGIGGMGWGLPAAAAAKLVYPERRVISLIGDGGAAMTFSTLATCVQENLPITVIVANNHGLGMVRDNMKGRRIAVDFSNTDFAMMARGMGCEGIRVNTYEGLRKALDDARSATVPVVIDVNVDTAASHVPASDY